MLDTFLANVMIAHTSVYETSSIFKIDFLILDFNFHEHILPYPILFFAVNSIPEFYAKLELSTP